MSAQQLGEQYPSALPNGEDAKGIVRITPSDPRFQSKAAAAIAPEAPTGPRLRPSHQLRVIAGEAWRDDTGVNEQLPNGHDGKGHDGHDSHDGKGTAVAEPASADDDWDDDWDDDKRGEQPTAVSDPTAVVQPVAPRSDEAEASDGAEVSEAGDRADDADGADPAENAADHAEPTAVESPDNGADDSAGNADDGVAGDGADDADDGDPADNGLGEPAEAQRVVTDDRREGGAADDNGLGSDSDDRPDNDAPDAPDAPDADAADNGLGVPVWGDDLPPSGRRGYDSPEIAAARTGRVMGTATVPTASRAKPDSGPSIPSPRRSAEASKRKPRRRSTMFALIAIAFVLVTNAFIAQPFSIPSGSMEQTMVEGDKVLTDKISPLFTEPERGEIVVFRAQDSWADGDYPTGVLGVGSDLLWRIGVTPPGQKNVIKRVIGLPGDKVACCDSEGRVTVNGVSIDETYIYRNSELIDRQFGPITVPDGRLFVMGDHRSDSGDSRAHLDDGVSGTIAEDAVIGRAIAVVWPLSHWRTLGDTERFADVPEPSSSNAARK